VVQSRAREQLRTGIFLTLVANKGGLKHFALCSRLSHMRAVSRSPTTGNAVSTCASIASFAISPLNCYTKGFLNLSDLGRSFKSSILSCFGSVVGHKRLSIIPTVLPILSLPSIGSPCPPSRRPTRKALGACSRAALILRGDGCNQVDQALISADFDRSSPLCIQRLNDLVKHIDRRPL